MSDGPRISPHFTLAELTTTEQRGADGQLLANAPGPSELYYLRKLCDCLLEPIRVLLGCPVHVNSAFRSPAVEVAVSGKAYGQHMLGQAADIVPLGVNLKVAYEAVLRSGLPFDQLLFEHGRWIHVSCAPDARQPRRQALMIGEWTGGQWAVYVPAAIPQHLV